MNKVQNVYYKKNTVKNSLYIFDFVILNLIYYFSLIYLTRKMEYHEVMTMLMVVTITFLSFRLYNMYQELEHIRYRELVVKSFIANAVSILGAGLVFNIRQDYGEKMMLTVFPITFIITTFTRLLVKKYICSKYEKTNILLIGEKDDLKDIVKKFFLKYFRTYNIAYIEPDDLTPEVFENIDEVLISQNIWTDKKEAIVAEILKRRLSYRIVPGDYEILVASSQAGQIYDSFIFSKMTSRRTFYRFVKRTMDIFGGLLMFMFGLPFMILAVLALKVESFRDPIFYTQERLTKDDRIFKVVKFRSMVVNAEDETGAVLAGKHDSRVTRVGHILRKFRIDEIPQCINIIKGDMSLVGPRPERPEFVEQFKEELPLYAYRHRVRSGLSGLAQISGFYSTPAADKLKHDLYYVEQHSIILDLKIMLLTLEVILTPSKAAGLDEYKTLRQLVDRNRFKIVQDGPITRIVKEKKDK